MLLDSPSQTRWRAGGLGKSCQACERASKQARPHAINQSSKQASKQSHNQSTNQSTVAILAQGSRCSRRYCQRYCVLPWGSTAISAMADQHLGPWYLIPTAKVVASLTDGDFFLVRASDVTLVTSTPTRPSTPYINDDTASPAPRAPYSDQTALLTPMILSRPQAGNGQSYFTMLHKWAGRSAGGCGRPMAGRWGNGSYGRW